MSKVHVEFDEITLGDAAYNLAVVYCLGEGPEARVEVDYVFRHDEGDDTVPVEGGALVSLMEAHYDAVLEAVEDKLQDLDVARHGRQWE